MGLVIFVSALVSIITSLAVWRFYINWQFYQSTAGYRLKEVLDASLLLVGEKGSYTVDRESTGLNLFSSKYKYSLGPVIPILFNAYKENTIHQASVYPRIDCFGRGNVWEIFDQHVRPVIHDINNNSFIGWLPGVPNVERLLALQRLCFQLEKVIGIVDLECRTNPDSLLNSDAPYIGEIVHLPDTSKQEEASTLLTELRSNCNLLEKYWREWFALVTKYKASLTS